MENTFVPCVRIMPFGRYYHLLCTRPFHPGQCLRSALRSSCSSHTPDHLHRPWWIPSPSWLSCGRLFWAFGFGKKPKVAVDEGRRLLTCHEPIRSSIRAPLFRSTGFDGSMRIEVLILTLPDAQLRQGVGGFGLPVHLGCGLARMFTIGEWQTPTRSRGDKPQLPSSLASQAYG